MEVRSPSIAAIGVIGRHNNPLHIALFPDYTGQPRENLKFTFMLNTSLDIFEARMPTKTVGHDFGLLHALDERIALYGWLLNTGIKLVIVVDMEGRVSEAPKGGVNVAGLGLRGADLTPAFQALQTAYIRLLRNPFYVPDEHNPKIAGKGRPLQINSVNFIQAVDRIGKGWYPGAINF